MKTKMTIKCAAFLRGIGDWFKNAWSAIKPGSHAWKGAGMGMLLVTIIPFLIAGYTVFIAKPRILSFLVASAQFLAIASIVGALAVLLVFLLKRIPAFYGWALVTSLVLLYVGLFIAATVSLTGTLLFMLAVIVVASLLGAGVWVLARGGWRTATVVQRLITVLGLVLALGGLAAGAIWLLGSGSPVEPPLNAAAMSAAQVAPLDMPDPSQPGPYEVRTLFYGSGNDRQRPEYGAGVDLVTGPVDGSPFTNGWTSARAQLLGLRPGYDTH